MSQADVERFVADLEANPDLLAEVTKNAGGIASIVEIATGKGYDVTLDEAKAYIQAQAKAELSDEQLDAIAGGKGDNRATHAIGPTVTEVGVVMVVTVNDGGGGGGNPPPASVIATVC